MLIPIEIDENYTYYLNLTKIDGLTLWHVPEDYEGDVPGWYLYLESRTSGLRKKYDTKEEALSEIERINKISGKILKIWEEN